MQILAKNLEIVATGDVQHYAGNSRRHSAKQIEKIAASIAQFGFNAPILVDADGTIVAGHGRHLAAQRLGLAQVPIIRLGHLTESQRRAYVIADNRIAEDAGWDLTKLATEVQALQADGFDLMVTGLDDVDFSRVEMELRKLAADLEMIEAPPQPVHVPTPAGAEPEQASADVRQPAPAPAPISYHAQTPQLTALPPAMVPFQVLLTIPQRDAVLAKLNAVKAQHALKTMGDALFHTCKEGEND